MNIRQAQLPEGWEIKKLGELYNITSSKRVFQDEWTSSGVPFYRAREIVKLAQNGFVNNELYISDEMYNEYSKKYGIPKEDDIMVTGVGTLGICYLVKSEDKFYFKDGNIIWLKTKGNVNSRYVEYAFKSDFLRKQIDDSVGATVGTYTIIKAKSTKIPVPPLPEQQRIVSILDEAFAAISKAKANAEQNLRNAKEFFESYLHRVFENGEWETKTLNEVCEIVSKLIDPRKPEFQKLIHIGAGNIETKTGLLSDLKTSKEENLISGKFLFDESMVLYSKIRPYLMKVVNCNFQGLCSADIYPLKPFEKLITKDYLYHLLLTKEFTDYAILGSQRAGMPKVNREHLFAYKIKLPSLKEQKVIVQNLDALSAETQKLDAIYKQKIKNLEELKKSILQKAFAGELKTNKEIMI